VVVANRLAFPDTRVERAHDTAPSALPRHAVSLRAWRRSDYERVWGRAEWMLGQPREVVAQSAPGMLLGVLFYQNSTRTRLSFEAAAQRIGGSAIGFCDAATTRAGDFYQESLEDTVRVVGGYADVLVLRHTDDDAAERAAAVSQVPVVSAGTGDREHPTQAMLDLWVLRSKLGLLSGLTLGYVGDPTCRYARSLIYGLAAFGAAGVVFLTPDGARIPDDVQRTLRAAGMSWHLAESAAEVLRTADAVSMIPFELSDFHESAVRSHSRSAELDRRFVFDSALLSRTGTGVPVVHTGPRGPELPPETDDVPNVHYFEGVSKGIHLRAALLAELEAGRRHG
jgi:aspartate carbamoyltransferase catalytic subunit